MSEIRREIRIPVVRGSAVIQLPKSNRYIMRDDQIVITVLVSTRVGPWWARLLPRLIRTRIHTFVVLEREELG